MKIFGILIFLISYNGYSETQVNPFGDTQPISEKVDELNKCIKRLKTANAQHKKIRKSRGPLEKVISVVDNIRYDKWTKILIGVMEEVKFRLTGSFKESHTVSGKLSKRKKRKLEKKFNNNYFSKKFAKNKKYYHKACVHIERPSVLDAYAHTLVVDLTRRPLTKCKPKIVIDVTPSEVHRILKLRPNTFCESKLIYFASLYGIDRSEMEENVNDFDELLKWSHNSLEESHRDIRSDAIFKASYRDYGQIIKNYRASGFLGDSVKAQ